MGFGSEWSKGLPWVNPDSQSSSVAFCVTSRTHQQNLNVNGGILTFLHGLKQLKLLRNPSADHLTLFYINQGIHIWFANAFPYKIALDRPVWEVSALLWAEMFCPFNFCHDQNLLNAPLFSLHLLAFSFPCNKERGGWQRQCSCSQTSLKKILKRKSLSSSLGGQIRSIHVPLKQEMQLCLLL